MPDGTDFAIDAIAVDTGEVLTLLGNRIEGLPGEGGPTWYRLPENLNVHQWVAVGEQLMSVEKSLMWWVGDWWVYGQKKYGERAAIVRDMAGPAFQTCADAGWVSGKFETSRRREVLTFNHHKEVAGLDDEVADELLDWAAEPMSSGDPKSKPRTIRELRMAVNRRKNVVGILPGDDSCTIDDLHAAVAKGLKFGTIYADPPWVYDNQATRAATGNHYEGLTVEQLCDPGIMPIRDLAADDAHLHLWVTNAFLRDSFKILDAWGFEFKSTFVWTKPKMGIGNYWRNSHEIMLTAVRGNATRFDDHSMMSWFLCDRGKHSSKPEQVRTFIERGSPGPYLELFSRRSEDEVPGWKVWGNGVERNIFSRPLTTVPLVRQEIDQPSAQNVIAFG
jgi:N6-adenosine-specific RNA methylase IME4